MSSQDIEPRLGAGSFSCPHCNAVANQDWYSLFLKPENADEVLVLTPETVTVRTLVEGKHEWNDITEIDQFVERLKRNEVTYVYQKHSQSLKVKMSNLHLSSCHSCNGFALWLGKRLAFPINVEKTPAPVEEDFEEAAAILNKFPRGATALMRVSIQKLMPLLRQDGENLNDSMSSLVRKGLEVEVQQAMEVLQVLGNGPVQPTSLDTEEDKEMALRFVDSLKAILERRMLNKGGG
jgi:inactivated superfamily I helicase